MPQGSRYCFVFIWFLLCFSFARHVCADQMEHLYDQSIGMKLGAPWDTKTNNIGFAAGSCIKFKDIEEKPDTTIWYSIYWKDAFQGPSGSFVRLGVRVQVNQFVQYLSQPQLTSKAQHLLVHNQSEFDKICGNSFVGSLVRGGQYDAEMLLDTKGQDQDHVNLEMSATGWLGTWLSKDKFKTVLNEILVTYPIKSLTERKEVRPSYYENIMIDAERLVRASLGHPLFVASRFSPVYLARFKFYGELNDAKNLVSQH